MITIQEALQIIDSQKIEFQPTIQRVADSTGYYLFSNVIAPVSLPGFDNSAMDGYAVCGAGDLFTVMGEIAAGDSCPYRLNEGEAYRIFTGAKVPENTTAVIMQEKTLQEEGRVKVLDEILTGKNIRRKGEEIQEGQIVFEIGRQLNPAAIGLLSSLGIEKVSVCQKPVVSILTTGNELVQPGKSLQSGQIYESNGFTIKAVVNDYDFHCMESTHEKDDYGSIVRAIGKLLTPSVAPHVLLISGGISVGEYDFVKQALEENDVEELFYKVKQKPGKPLFFGRKENQFVFALPGNPASALTCFYLYVLPLLQQLAGAANPGLLKFQAALAHDYHLKSDRPVFMKSRFNGELKILEGQSSSMLHSFAMANALTLLEGPRLYKKGDMVYGYLLNPSKG